jgi:hypothetical protein
MAANLGGQYKNEHDAPIDHIMLRETFGGEGSSLDILHRAATELCAQYKTTISRRTVQNLLPAAGVKLKKFTNDGTQLNIAQHHAASHVKTVKQIYSIFSGNSIMLSVDALQNTRVNSDKNNKGRGELQVDISRHGEGPTTDSKGTPLHRPVYVDHSANGVSSEAKLSLFSMYKYGNPGKDEQRTVSDEVFSLMEEQGIPHSWENAEAKAVSLGHVETFDPETAARNGTSILEFLEELEMSGDALNALGELCENLFIEMDGAHCSREEAGRFVTGLIFHVLDLNAMLIFTNAGGQSKFNTAEQINGGVARRVNGTIVHVDPVEYEISPAARKNAMLGTVLKKLCVVCDHATCMSVRGGVRVKPAVGPSNYPSFLSSDVRSFLGGSDAFRAAFVGTPSNSYSGSEIGSLFRLVYVQMEDLRCCRVARQSLTWRKHPDVPGMKAIRGNTDMLKYLDTFFDGYDPQPRPSNRVGSVPSELNPSGSYQQPDERMKLSFIEAKNGGVKVHNEKVDLFHPRLLFDSKWDIIRNRFLVSTEDGLTLPTKQMKVLVETLRCAPGEILEECRRKLAQCKRKLEDKEIVHKLKASGHLKALLLFIEERSATKKSRISELNALLQLRGATSMQRKGSKARLLQSLMGSMSNNERSDLGACVCLCICFFVRCSL